MRVIDRAETQRVVSTGGQVVEVLAGEEFGWAHLPDAVNLPLRDLDHHASHLLDRGRPVIAYCHDFL